MIKSSLLITLVFFWFVLVKAQNNDYIDPVNHTYITNMKGMHVVKTDSAIYFVSDDSSKVDLDKKIPLSKALMKNFDSMPLMHPYANYEGSYVLVINADKENINPGDKIIFEVYITGYGVGQRAKIFFETSSAFYDTLNSQAFVDGNIIDSSLVFGVDSYPLHPNGYGKIWSLGGAQLVGKDGKRWPFATPFFDMHPFDNLNGLISTESKLGKAPQQFEIKTLSNIESGMYSVHFVLTYFDGVKWRNDDKVFSFEVSTWPERNWISILIFSVILGPLLIELLKLIFSRFSKRKIYQQNLLDTTIQNSIASGTESEKEVSKVITKPPQIVKKAGNDLKTKQNQKPKR